MRSRRYNKRRMRNARGPRTIAQVRAFMQTIGPMETTVLATTHPPAEVQRKAARVAQHLVGGLPEGPCDSRVDRLAFKLARLVEADTAATTEARSSARRKAGRG